MNQPSRKSLRSELRQRRRSLTPAQQRQAARKLCQNILGSGTLTFRSRWALYTANDGEIDPVVLQTALQQRGRRIFFPVLHPVLTNQLWFVEINETTRFRKNRFGIKEPVISGHRAPVWTMSVVGTPLVGFDRKGRRLGMGGGFYDRSLAPMKTRIRTPILAGFAHQCQEVDKLPDQAWDIPMSLIATDSNVMWCQR